MFNKYFALVPAAVETSAKLAEVKSNTNDERQRLVEEAQACLSETHASDENLFTFKKCA